MSHQYKHMTPEERENINSSFLIESWSYSKVNQFASNEKAFEMVYVYGNEIRSSATAVAGQAYHEALKHYFSESQKLNKPDLADLQKIAYEVIDGVEANKWKLQKTTPTIEECKKKATAAATTLLTSFLKEVSLYEDEIKQILDVELYCSEFLTVNGVDIPLPCHAMIDLVVETVEGKIVVIDHKSKSVFTDEKELKFSIGKQGITYVSCYEARTGLEVNEVWFVENKVSENRDKSPQLSRYKMILDKDTRRLYEALLYEPLKRMLEAVSNPDYVYLINENDNFVDKAEIYEFWAQTMIAEVGDFNIPESKRELVKKRLSKIRDASMAAVDPKVIKNFRENASQFIQYDLTNKNMSSQEKIEHTLRTLGISVRVAHTFNGYSSDTFLLEVSAGTNLSSVHRYKLDIANALNVSSIRMMKDLFVYEGKSYLAVESMKKRERDLPFDPALLHGMRIPVGIDNFGQQIVWDLENPATPHLLICGSTGSGKSVCIISILEYARLAGIDEIVVCDPKHEFTRYQGGGGISVYNDIELIEEKMESLVKKMNNLVKYGLKEKTLIIFDEFADAVSAAKSGNALNVYKDEVIGSYADGRQKTKRVVAEVKKSLEENLKILLQKGRSSGFRIIAATQRASTKVITGDAKVNFPVQICFRVPKEVDSKVVIDEAGGEALAGKGDGLIKSPEYPGVVRFQAFYKG